MSEQAGMRALRVLCEQHGTPTSKQSHSDEDIVLWADAKMRDQQAEIERLQARLDMAEISLETERGHRQADNEESLIEIERLRVKNKNCEVTTQGRTIDDAVIRRCACLSHTLLSLGWKAEANTIDEYMRATA